MLLNIASLGDCCVDIYKSGNYLGGTAFNVALNAQKLGAKSSLFSAIGSDVFGEKYLVSAAKTGIDLNHLQTHQGITSSINIDVGSNSQPTFSNWNLGVLESYALNHQDTAALKQQDIVRIVLFKPMKRVFDQFSTLNLSETLTVADFADDSKYCESVSVINQYLHRFDIIIKSLAPSDIKSINYLQQLAHANPAKIFLILLGSHGSKVFRGKQEFYQPIVPTKVVDINGAGDSFVATFLISFH